VFPTILITMTIEVQKMIDSNNECQTRPLAEQTLDDFDEYFRSCPGMTFVFLAPGEVNTVYPDVITAIQVVDCLSRGMHFEPAFDHEPPLPPADTCSRKKLVSIDGNDEIGCLLAEEVQELFEHC